MKQLLIILFAASLLAGCKGKNASKGWSAKDRDEYTKACVPGATTNLGSEEKAKTYCSCMLTKLEAKYSSADDAGKLDLSTMTEMAKECVK